MLKDLLVPTYLDPTIQPPYILFPEDVFDGDANNATLAPMGGKARALAELSQFNLPIPAWFVILPAAFQASLMPAQRELLTVEAIAPEQIRDILSKVHIKDTVQQAIQQAIQRLCPAGERVAVRSSALEEDGQQQSYAGQLESFLFVSPENVTQKIIEVWQSGFSDRLLAYVQEQRSRQQHPHTDFPSLNPPAVLVQRMVEAEVAGVAFSANPVTGQRSEAVISSVYGLGTALVSGDADADTFHVDRQGQIVEQQIATKSIAHRWEANRQDWQSVSVKPSLQHQSTLADSQILAIATLVRQVAHLKHRPQDIEWAIANDQLYLLQARPITALTSMPDPDGVRHLWDNSNIAESYSGITTPLTFSFVRRAYEEVYRQFCHLMGVPSPVIANHAATFRRMLGLVQGRIYYNLLNWYRVLALLPGFKANRQFMEQMMGVKEPLPEDIVAELDSSTAGDRLKDMVRLGKTLVGLVRNYLNLPTQIKAFYHRLNDALKPPDLPLTEMRPDELIAYYLQLEQQLLTRWDAPIVNDFFAMIFYGVLRKLAIAWCGDESGTLQNDLISGEGGMISAEPARQIKQLAMLAQQNPQFVQCLCDGSVTEIQQQIAQFPAFQSTYQTYLNAFGDRCLEELKLESATLHDNPLLLLRSVGQLATRDIATTPGESSPSLRDMAEAKVKSALKKNPWRRSLFAWVLANARSRVRDRENLRFERTRLFGRVRQIVVELGRRFYALDLIADPNDIFYLELDEILGMVDATITCTDLHGLIAVRQQEFKRYRQDPEPSDRFSTQGLVYPSNSFTETSTESLSISNDAESLNGLGCCPGIVRAPVRVITDPRQAILPNGHILVAERTDPGWIMLFPSASGVLVERGSLLSHSAIVARELGIPAIVSIPGVTQWLKDGDWVEMDGSTGQVQRIVVDQDHQNAH